MSVSKVVAGLHEPNMINFDDPPHNMEEIAYQRLLQYFPSEVDLTKQYFLSHIKEESFETEGKLKIPTQITDTTTEEDDSDTSIAACNSDSHVFWVLYGERSFDLGTGKILIFTIP